MILESKKPTIVLVSSHLSLSVVIRNPTPAKIVNSARELHRMCVFQDIISTDYWGENVKKISKAELIKRLVQQISKNKFHTILISGMQNVLQIIRSMSNADFFEIL